MRRHEFENLKEGDIVVFQRGHDAGRECEVVYIDYNSGGKHEAILVRSLDRKPFYADTAYGNLRLTSWIQIDLG